LRVVVKIGHGGFGSAGLATNKEAENEMENVVLVSPLE
jgi:hypothetical protein